MRIFSWLAIASFFCVQPLYAADTDTDSVVNITTKTRPARPGPEDAGASATASVQPEDESTANAVIFGCSSLVLTEEERAFFAVSQPLGFILFKRNIDTPEQVRALVADLRSCVNHSQVPILLDQEGGRVSRLRPPHWRKPPAAGVFGELHAQSPDEGLRATYLNARLIAHDLTALGINVNCAPNLDMRTPTSHKGVVGDRSFSDNPEAVTALGQQAIEGHCHGGVVSVLKHLPTHGPAFEDSHEGLPVIDLSLEELEPHFKAFRENAHSPWAMTAHVIYSAIDSEAPATLSATVIQDIIRGAIGFQGFLVCDALEMKALTAPLAERAQKVLEAGCDAVLHCNGILEQMVEVMDGVNPLTEAATQRLMKGYEQLQPQVDFNPEEALAELNSLLSTQEEA